MWVVLHAVVHILQYCYNKVVANESLNGGTNKFFVAQKFMSTNVHIGLFAS
jgi:hypothetical protein